MMLRASVDETGGSFEMNALGGAEDAQGDVPHQDLLLSFAEVVTVRDTQAASRLRVKMIKALGIDGYVDACGVAAGFHGFTRVADCAGVQVDSQHLAVGGAALQAEIGIDDYFTLKNA